MIQWNYCPVCSAKMTADEENRPACSKGHFTKYPTPVASTLSIVRSDNDYLILQRSREPQKGEWVFPGGFVEYNETGYQTAARELKEETKIQDAEFVELIGTFPSTYGHIEKALTLSYLFETKNKTITISEEHKDYKWLPLEKIPPLAFDDCNAALKSLRKRSGIIQ